MYNVRDMDWMFKSMSMCKRDNNGIVKSDFATSRLAFRALIPIVSAKEIPISCYQLFFQMD